jgi:hypothetical protein
MVSFTDFARESQIVSKLSQIKYLLIKNGGKFRFRPPGFLDPDRYNGGDWTMTNPMLPADDAKVRFCWLRESAPGHLECDLGLSVERSSLGIALVGLHPDQQRTSAQPPVSPEQARSAFESEARFLELPQWARKRLAALFGPLSSASDLRAARENHAILCQAAQRALAAAPRGGELELHLPYLDRRHWPARFEVLAKTAFRFANGRVVPAGVALSADESNLYETRLMAAGVERPEAPVYLRHVHACALPAEVAALMYEAAFGAGIDAGAGSVALSIERRLKFAALSAWRRAPLEKSPAYFPAHAAVSVAVQRALRSWIAWTWLSDPDRCENVVATHAILAYAASKPFPGRRRTDFTWDVLGNEWIYGAFHQSRRDLTCRLRLVQSALVAAGRPELARSYEPGNAKDILAQIRKRNKIVRDLFAGEGEIVNHLLNFGLTLRSAGHSIEICREAADFSQGLGARLRRLVKGQDLTSLGAMILIEASNALHMELGGNNAAETETIITPTQALELRAA